MIKMQLRPLVITLILLLIHVAGLFMWKMGWLLTYPLTACAISGWGMMHTALRPILTYFNLNRVRKLLDIFIFCALSATLLYIENWIDVPLFILVMTLFLRTVTLDCNYLHPKCETEPKAPAA